MSAAVATLGRATKACFVISPMGASFGETRKRGDYVLKNFIKPACLLAGYDARRSDELKDQDITRAIRDSLFGSPMAIAYLGSRFSCTETTSSCNVFPAWNDSVMVEVGYRLAAQLPVLFVCDDTSNGGSLRLPALLGMMRTVLIPSGKDELDPAKPADKARIDELVNDLAERIRFMEADTGSIGSEHAVAMVHSRIDGLADPSDPENMFFVSASGLATELFGFDDSGTGRPRLAGRTMQEFLRILKYRMPRRQYDEFLESQNQARSAWTGSEGAEGWRTPTVHIPIVFDRHPRSRRFIGRAYLPIIVNKFESGNSWSTLRVLYLDVTSVTRKQEVENGFVYVCEIDPKSKHLEFPSEGPLNLFLCHNSKDKPVVEKLLERLAHLSPQAVHSWLDKTDIAGGEKYVNEIGWIVRNADVAFVFLGKNGLGKFQVREIQAILDQSTAEARKKLVILPILLDNINPAQVQTPDSWALLAPEEYAHLEEVDSDDYLTRFFETHFPGRLVF